MRIKRKPLFSRLALLSSGRRHYLEFLRNFAAQIILLGMAWQTGRHINFSPFALDDAFRIFFTIVLVSAAVLAYYVNARLFYEACFHSLIKWRRRVGIRLRAHNRTGWWHLKTRFWAIGRYKLVEFIEVIFVIYLCVQVFPIVVLGYSILNFESLAGTREPLDNLPR